MGLLETLKTKILTADGAMGTLLYSFGLENCHEEMNIEKPEIIEKIHLDYIEAGADVIQTNTYGANRIKLARYGLASKVVEINEAAVRLAKKAATPGGQYVLGSIGGIRGIRKSDYSLEEIVAALKEQAEVLIREKVDGILLETFYDFEELSETLKVIRSLTDLPIIAQVSMEEPGVLTNGMKLNDAFKTLENLGADIVGVNCRLGPYHTIQALEKVELPNKAYLSAYPNASLLDIEEGRVIYESEVDYFAEQSVELCKQGVRLIGGCCGTTPKHIKAMKILLSNLEPVETKERKVQEPITIQEAEPVTFEPLHEKVKRERSVIVELDTPRHLEIDEFVEGAKTLYNAGADLIMMADNSLASPRISNLAMGAILKQHGIRVMPHLTCRDRNLIGLQSHLMGLNAIGFHDILVVTGDPTKIGDFPGAASVYDVSSMELISLIKKQLNEGISFSGKSLRKKANFSVAAAFNPNVRVLDRAISRLEKKIEHGADYFISQPVYSKEKIEEIYEATKHLSAPIYIGIMPLTSYKGAQFLHHEVPGIKLSEEALERMKQHEGNRELEVAEGLAIAKELLDTATKYFNGIYLITPFLRYDVTTELIKYIQKIDVKNKGEKANV